MSDKYSIVLEPDGRMYSVRKIKQEMQVTDSLVDAICKDRKTIVPNIAHIDPFGQISAVFQPNLALFTVALPFIEVRCSYTVQNNTVVPNPGGKEPEMKLVWYPPSGCIPKLLVGVSSSELCHYTSWLFALDSSKRTYKLPLPNTYDDCKLCLGDSDFQGASVLHVLNNVLAQFQNGKWNTDLLTRPEQLQALFRWKPEGDKFVSAAPVNWTDYCVKVAIPQSEDLL